MSVVEQLKKEIALRHHTQLQGDDPLLMNATTLDVVLEHATKRFEELLDKTQKQMVVSAQDSVDNATKIANNLIARNLQTLHGKIQEAVETIADDVEKKIKEQADEQTKADRRMYQINLAVCFITVAVAAFTLGMWFHLVLSIK